MKKLLFVFCFFFAVVVGYAQTPTLSYLGVLNLQDGNVLEGNVTLDFEQRLIAFTNDGQERLLAFSAVQSVLIFDNQTKLRREFIGLKYNELYEVVLAGELSLLRYYHKNPQDNTSCHANISYSLYELQHHKVVAIKDLANNMGDVFNENLGLIRNIISTKNYDLHNLQHIATLVRYHNQCRAKAVAQQ
jgi:hypothetical protein